MANAYKLEITQNMGYWRLDPTTGKILDICREHGSPGKWAIEFVYVNKDAMTVADGSRLLSLAFPHKLPVGLYMLTQKWYLLPVQTDRKFPPWQRILADEKHRQIIGTKLSISNNAEIACLIYRINREAKTAINFDLFLPVVEQLAEMRARDVMVCTNSEHKEGESPFELHGSFGQPKDMTFIYTQMPVQFTE